MTKTRTLTRRKVRIHAKVRKERLARIAREAKASHEFFLSQEAFKRSLPSDWEQQLYDRDVRLGLIFINNTPK